MKSSVKRATCPVDLMDTLWHPCFVKMKQPVDREAVKVLAIAVGVREAARQLGLNENRVLKWSERGRWFKDTIVPKPLQQSDVITVIKPSEALAKTLKEHENETRISLALSARRMAKDCEELPVRHADKAYTVAKTMALVHRQGEQGSSSHFTLNMLNVNWLSDNVSDNIRQES